MLPFGSGPGLDSAAAAAAVDVGAKVFVLLVSNGEGKKSSTENTFVTSKKSWLFVTDLFRKHQRTITSFRLAGLDWWEF